MIESESQQRGASEVTIDIRTAARDKLRAEIADQAFDELMASGYSALSVEDLARRVGISKATFFRYFDSKEDVVLGVEAPPEYDAPATVQAAIEQGDTRPFDLACRALRSTLPTPEHQNHRLRARIKMVADIPSLRGRLAVRRGEREARFAAALAASTGQRPESQLAAALAFTCLDTAWRDWAAADNADVIECFDQTVTRARQLVVGEDASQTR